MYNRRKIVKRNPSKVVQKPSKGMLSSNGWGKYVFPICGEVPGGYYYSKIMHAEDSITSTGKDAVDVLYKIKYGPTIYKAANKIVPEDTEIETYYIRQRYPKNTSYYYGLEDAMAACTGNQHNTYKDIIGVTEYIVLGYGDKNDMGGITKRCPMTSKEFIKACRNDYNSRKQIEEEAIADEYVEEPEYDDSYDW